MLQTEVTSGKLTVTIKKYKIQNIKTINKNTPLNLNEKKLKLIGNQDNSLSLSLSLSLCVCVCVDCLVFVIVEVSEVLNTNEADLMVQVDITLRDSKTNVQKMVEE